MSPTMRTDLPRVVALGAKADRAVEAMDAAFQKAENYGGISYWATWAEMLEAALEELER